MHLIWQDLRYGVRLLRKAPGFAAVALVALALGIGATTAIFSVVDAVLLKPLPFRDPERLLVIWEKNPTLNKVKLFVAPANFLAWQRQSRTTETMAALQDVSVNLTGGPNGHVDPEELRGERVSATLFPLLGVQPVVGRTFREDEDQPGNAFAALLSYSLWQRRFGGDRAIVGKTIRLRDQPYTVTGVLPHDFAVLEPNIDLWIPLGLNGSDPRVALSRFLVVIARRKDTLDRVRAEFDAIGGRLEQSMPELNRGWRPSIFTVEGELVGDIRRSLWVLLAAVGCLLLMACVNVANLLLSRGAGRRRELALRLALGAGRARIVNQLLAESVLLSLGGGALGLLLATAVIRGLAHSGTGGIPRLAFAAVDLRLFVFALAVSLLTGIVFGAVPAWATSGANLVPALNQGGRSGTTGRAGRAVRNGLVVVEVALAVVVLIGAGLLIRSFIRLRSTNPGFEPAGLLTMRVPLAGLRNAAPERKVAFVQELTGRIGALAGVRSVGGVNGLPLTGLGNGVPFIVEGQPAPAPSQWPVGVLRSVTPAYFRTLGIPLVAGRTFSASDDAQAPLVIVINRTLASRFWPASNPIGAHLILDFRKPRSAEVIGVVGDVKPERPEAEDWPTIYNAYSQAPVNTMTLAVRCDGPPLALALAAQREVQRLDPDQPVADVRTMDDVVSKAVSGARFNTGLLTAFAAIAFVLAAVGIYGVISYDVSERTNEIGIRMALGAQPGDLLRLVVGEAARMALYGITAGLAISFAVTRLMATMLYSVNPTDAYTFWGISILLALVALAASYLPSRRALALNPVNALRHE
ncbi:MAG TPA: ABC transporter permease [Candidatus Acidoferrales bacterium]|nr:ABC transporter permease [Candidatus Acidoferrales bacterium]